MSEINWANQITAIQQVATDSQITQLQAQINEIKAKLAEITSSEVTDSL